MTKSYNYKSRMCHNLIVRISNNSFGTLVLANMNLIHSPVFFHRAMAML